MRFDWKLEAMHMHNNYILAGGSVADFSKMDETHPYSACVFYRFEYFSSVPEAMTVITTIDEMHCFEVLAAKMSEADHTQIITAVRVGETGNSKIVISGF
jgi:hypothetical protein